MIVKTDGSFCSSTNNQSTTHIEPPEVLLQLPLLPLLLRGLHPVVVVVVESWSEYLLVTGSVWILDKLGLTVGHCCCRDFAQILHWFCTHFSLVCVCSGSDAGWEYWRLVTTTCTIYTQTPLQPSPRHTIDTCTTWTRYLASSQWKSTLRSHFFLVLSSWWLLIVFQIPKQRHLIVKCIFNHNKFSKFIHKRCINCANPMNHNKPT